MRGQPETALVDIYRAHRLRPGDAYMLVELIRNSNHTGLLNARKYIQKLVQLDPLNLTTYLSEFAFALISGPKEAAVAPARRLISLAPHDSMFRVYAGFAIAECGFREEGATVLRRAGEAITDNPHGPFALFLSYALDGREEEALRIATQEVEQTVHNDIACRFMADGYALLGRKDDALRWVCCRWCIRSGASGS